MEPKNKKDKDPVGAGLAPTEQPGDKNALTEKPVIDFAEDAGKGFEGTDKAAFAIPFIVVLQGQSPQIEAFEKAKPGMLFNTITNECMTTALVIPCAYQRRFIRWAPRDVGGGYRGEYDPIAVELNQLEGLRQEEGQYYIEDDELKDTRNHYVMVQAQGSGQWLPAVLSLGSTQIKKSKKWMSRISGIELRTPAGKPYQPPSYSHIYRLTTAKEENSKGSWHGVELEMVGPVEDVELYGKAKTFHKAVTEGQIKATPPAQDAEAGGGDRADGKF